MDTTFVALILSTVPPTSRYIIYGSCLHEMIVRGDETMHSHLSQIRFDVEDARIVTLQSGEKCRRVLR